MASLWAFLDSSAYARGGHGYSSCHPNCGSSFLTGIALIVLAMLLYQGAKFAFTESGNLGVSALVLVLCGGVAIGALFVGPVLMLVGLVVAVAAYIAIAIRIAR